MAPRGAAMVPTRCRAGRFLAPVKGLDMKETGIGGWGGQTRCSAGRFLTPRVNGDPGVDGGGGGHAGAECPSTANRLTARVMGAGRGRANVAIAGQGGARGQGAAAAGEERRQEIGRKLGRLSAGNE